YMLRLLDVLRRMAPTYDWSQLAAFVRRLAPEPPDPSDKLDKIVHPAVLLALAEQLIDAGNEAAGRPQALTGKRAAVLYRDGLMLAVLVFSAMRRRSLLSLALDE